MEGGQTILDPPDQQAGSSRAADKKPMVFSFGGSLLPLDTPQADADEGRQVLLVCRTAR